MAKRKTKLNTDLEEDLEKVKDIDVGMVDDIPLDDVVLVSEVEEADDTSYTMGHVVASDAPDSEEEDNEEFKKASQLVTAPDEDSEEEGWVEEDYNFKDEDEFLDLEDYDSDNPGQDDNY